VYCAASAVSRATYRAAAGLSDTIVVTGASRGLGAHCATRLHEAGYRVIGIGRKPAKNLPYITRIADVADPESVKAAVRRSEGATSPCMR
jgi:NAD(P)-dependent dehydrogenase (short-subunit alcohol dehydrogenase family)